MVPDQIRTRCLLNTRLSLPKVDLGLYHGPRPDIYYSTEWSLNTGLSLHRGPRPGGPILLREGLLMLLRKINTHLGVSYVILVNDVYNMVNLSEGIQIIEL